MKSTTGSATKTVEHSITDRINSIFAIQDDLNRFLAKENTIPAEEISFVDLLGLSYLLESLPWPVSIWDYCSDLSTGLTTAIVVNTDTVIGCQIPWSKSGQMLSRWNSRIETNKVYATAQTSEGDNPVISIIPSAYLESGNPLAENKIIPISANSVWIVVGINQPTLRKYLPGWIRNGYRVNHLGDLIPGMQNCTLALVTDRSSDLSGSIQKYLGKQQIRNLYQSLVKSCIDHELCGNPNHLKRDLNLIIARAIEEDNRQTRKKTVLEKIGEVLSNEGIISLVKRASKKIYQRLPVKFRSAS